MNSQAPTRPHPLFRVAWNVLRALITLIATQCLLLPFPKKGWPSGPCTSLAPRKIPEDGSECQPWVVVFPTPDSLGLMGVGILHKQAQELRVQSSRHVGGRDPSFSGTRTLDSVVLGLILPMFSGAWPWINLFTFLGIAFSPLHSDGVGQEIEP